MIMYTGNGMADPASRTMTAYLYNVDNHLYAACPWTSAVHYHFQGPHLGGLTVWGLWTPRIKKFSIVIRLTLFLQVSQMQMSHIGIFYVTL